MSLYRPAAPEEIGAGPRLHALVIGVGDYPHLAGGAGHPAVTNFNLQQLTTTVLTAKRIAEWLASSYTHPAVPLGSIELLLSPAQEVPRPGGGAPLAIEAPTMANVAAAFRRWFDRLEADAGNIAFFYFAGHGISTASQYLLTADFGDPGELDLWEKSIDFNKMRVGMYRNAARTQLFFVDACRERPIDALVQLAAPGGKSFGIANIFDPIPDSSAYHAAADGQLAYGPSDGVTFFATAVIEALEGAGAMQQNGQWVVDTFQLGSGLGHVMNALASENGLPLSCNPNAGGRPRPIHFPASPKVRARVGCLTEQANAEAAIELKQGADTLRSPAGDPRPWKGRLALGRCEIDMRFQTFPAVDIVEKVIPPTFEYTEPI